MVATASRRVPVGLDDLSVLVLAAPARTIEGNRRMAARSAAGSLCRLEPIGAPGLRRWDDRDRVLRDPACDPSTLGRNQPSPGAAARAMLDTLLREDPPDRRRRRGADAEVGADRGADARDTPIATAAPSDTRTARRPARRPPIFASGGATSSPRRTPPSASTRPGRDGGARSRWRTRRWSPRAARTRQRRRRTRVPAAGPGRRD